MKNRNAWTGWPVADGFLRFIALVCFSYAGYLALRYASQPLLDKYFFRQTQTALTSLWMMKDGFRLAYETPVAGAPWSIPFEFPLYQYVVALVARVTTLPLTDVGRVTSFVFLALCLWPVRTIVRLLKLESAVFWVFSSLLLSSPVYLYWGRSFMIETASLFFVLVAIRFFIELLQGSGSGRHALLFLVFMGLSILQKATTGLPVLAVLGLVFFFSSLIEFLSHGRDLGAGKRARFVMRRIGLAVLYVGVPLAVGVLWTLYTDKVKESNPLGVHLTSKALSAWNWGAFGQRTSPELYTEVFWNRMWVQNLAGLLGFATVLLFLCLPQQRGAKTVVASALVMAFAPLLLFTNLHLVHTYYQSANLLFAIFALAVSIVYVSRRMNGDGRPLVLFVVIAVSSNHYWFSDVYSTAMKESFSVSKSRELGMAEILSREIPAEKGFVAFGSDWNSALAYFSGRRSFTVPVFMGGYEENSKNPSNYMRAADLGGVTLCPPVAHPTLTDLQSWSVQQKDWKIGVAHGCYLAFPAHAPLDAGLRKSAVQCEGALDGVALQGTVGEQSLLAVGWLREKEGPPGGDVYLSLEKEGSPPLYLEALRVWRQDINDAFPKPLGAYHGFSRVVDIEALHGAYKVGITRKTGETLEQCQFFKDVLLP